MINRERDLFLSKNSNSYEILKLCHFLFLGNDKQLFLYIVLYISELLVIVIVSIFVAF